MVDAGPGSRDVVGMRAVVQRVTRARVKVGDEAVGSIERGLVVLVGVMREDAPEDSSWLERKVASLRVFNDPAGRMNLAVGDVGGRVLLISQFTLCAETSKGARPSFGRAMAPEPAQVLLDLLAAGLRRVVGVETGRFGASMAVELVNDGPVTFWLDSQGGR